MRHVPGNDLSLGQIAGSGRELQFPRTLRDKHLYICGGTGTGKSKLLEHLIRQDIKNWHKSKCGLIVFDPHGSLYDSLIKWLAWSGHIFKDLPIIPIDFRQSDWVVSYNLLRERNGADPAVLVDNLTDAMAYAWGQAGTNQTPLFARWAGNVLRALYEQGLTLVEAELLVDRVTKQLRSVITSGMKDKSSRHDWLYANALTPAQFDDQIGSTVNRLRKFISNETMKRVFGLPTHSLDLGRALEEGSIILVNLATEGAKISSSNAELFATVLLSDLWIAAQERGKKDGIKPFYCYLDEFQRFVTPTIADNLDQARGFGLHMTMAQQFPLQLLDRGDAGKRVYHSVMENASSKIVFRLSDPENLEPLAKWLFMGTMNPDEIKHELYSTKVMEYRREMFESVTETSSSGRSGGSQTGRSGGAGSGGTRNFYDDEETLERSESDSRFASNSESESEGWSESTSVSQTWTETLVPKLGKELSSVQFRTIEEQVFRAMAVLFDQKQRRGVARLVETKVPVSIVSPTVNDVPKSAERTQRFLDRVYEKLPFALRGIKARQELELREKTIGESLIGEIEAELGPVKRRISS